MYRREQSVDPKVLLQDGVLAWGMAGVAGALITVVWNYAVSSTLVWPAAR